MPTVSFPRDQATNAQRDTARHITDYGLINRFARIDQVAGHEVEADLLEWEITRRGLGFIHDPNNE